MGTVFVRQEAPPPTGLLGTFLAPACRTMASRAPAFRAPASRASVAPDRDAPKPSIVSLLTARPAICFSVSVGVCEVCGVCSSVGPIVGLSERFSVFGMRAPDILTVLGGKAVPEYLQGLPLGLFSRPRGSHLRRRGSSLAAREPEIDSLEMLLE